jgi:aminoglycoside phosphotransferase (APT) family kinase protein
MAEPVPQPPDAALHELGRQLGLDVTQARALRMHDASTLLLPAHHLVVRLVGASAETLTRATKALQLTAWLSTQAFPSVRPAIAEPIQVAGHVATVWHEIPAYPRPDSHLVHTALGRILRNLHALPTPPVVLPTADPLARLRTALDTDAHRGEPVLSSTERAFLAQQVQNLAQRYAAMTFPLGTGLIHNDAHPGNVLPDPTSQHGFVLTDWESACIGPREMDVVLVGAPGSRFGDTEDERLAFTAGYGYDIGTWPGYRILRDIRDLHSLAGHLRAAPHQPTALNELRTRIASLRDDDRTVRWKAV